MRRCRSRDDHPATTDSTMTIPQCDCIHLQSGWVAREDGDKGKQWNESWKQTEEVICAAHIVIAHLYEVQSSGIWSIELCGQSHRRLGDDHGIGN